MASKMTVDQLREQLAQTEYTGQTVDQLKEQLNQTSYTPRTDEQLQSEAERRYSTAYNRNKLAAQQQYEQTDLALTNQLASLGRSYDKQREEAAKATADSRSSFDRYSLQRGMQRSSYNAASIANIMNEGNKVQAGINEAEGTARAGIESQRTLNASQLAAQLAQYDSDYANDVAAYIDELRNQDYERQLAQQQYNNQLAMSLYEMSQQDYERRLAQDQYNNQMAMAMYEYEQKYGNGSSGSSSGKSSSSPSSNNGGTTPPPSETPQNTGIDFNGFMNALGESGGSKSTLPNTPAFVGASSEALKAYEASRSTTTNAAATAKDPVEAMRQRLAAGLVTAAAASTTTAKNTGGASTVTAKNTSSASATATKNKEPAKNKTFTSAVKK